MKNLQVMLAMIASLGAISSSGQTPGDLEGIWKMTYKKWELSDTVIELTKYQFPSYKIYFEDHFSLSRIEDGEFVGHFGFFKLDGNTYTEMITFSSYDYLVGRTLKFKSKLEGNKWTIEGDIGTGDQKLELVEVWKRLE